MHAPQSQPSAAIRQRIVRRRSGQARSIVEYQRLVAVGHYLNRLLRGLHSETASDPLMRLAQVEAENRYSQVRPRSARGLPWISVQARIPIAEVTEEEAERLRGRVNSEIKDAIRRLGKTRIGQTLSDSFEEKNQLRRIFMANVQRF